MNIALWIVQALLAIAFLAAGILKTVTPVDQMAAQAAWVSAVPAFVPKLAGISEILGAVGLLLPSVTRIKPMLTPLAALGLLTVMLLAALLHLSLGELGELVINLVLGSLALFVAWGRGKKLPLQPRTAATR